jgi:hypothetical protein
MLGIVDIDIKVVGILDPESSALRERHAMNSKFTMAMMQYFNLPKSSQVCALVLGQ